mmetsp:Transcript_104006/g.333350  ORF Transcript_104006/g.333350 Transcript_104006/m.333350 type:complete len:222 (-) Transcript_104006:207-872(-)
MHPPAAECTAHLTTLLKPRTLGRRSCPRPRRNSSHRRSPNGLVDRNTRPRRRRSGRSSLSRCCRRHHVCPCPQQHREHLKGAVLQAGVWPWHHLRHRCRRSPESPSRRCRCPHSPRCPLDLPHNLSPTRIPHQLEGLPLRLHVLPVRLLPRLLPRRCRPPSPCSPRDRVRRSMPPPSRRSHHRHRCSSASNLRNHRCSGSCGRCRTLLGMAVPSNPAGRRH